MRGWMWLFNSKSHLNNSPNSVEVLSGTNSVLRYLMADKKSIKTDQCPSLLMVSDADNYSIFDPVLELHMLGIFILVLDFLLLYRVQRLFCTFYYVYLDPPKSIISYKN